MAEKLKIIPLGGLNEIGKNMTAYEYGGEIIVVDCGMAFPGDDMYGIDSIIPDVSYLIKNKGRIRVHKTCLRNCGKNRRERNAHVVKVFTESRAAEPAAV